MTYGDTAHPHAVTALANGGAAANDNSYKYDVNGNMIQRSILDKQTLTKKTFALEYDAENRLVKVCQDANADVVCDENQPLIASFVYDGDGKRVISKMGSETTLFVGAHYEITNPGFGQTVTKYYFAGAQRIAMRKYVIPASMEVEYMLGDHLGSTSLTTDDQGEKVSEIRYTPWGEIRDSWTSGAATTPEYKLRKYTFTGQYSYMDDPTTQGTTEGFGLMFYQARWYDPYITQFSQPDSIIPDPYNPQDWNRYAYARYNPLVYTDPTGHDPVLGFIGGFLKELARTNLWWHPGAQRDLAIHNNESTAELTGRLVADVASMAIGVAEAGGGAGVAGGGVVACGTGVGCLVTPEALVAGGALIAQGAGTTLNAANGAGTILTMLSRGNGNQGDGSFEPNFVDQDDLLGHFDDHKDEFGYQTPEEYLSGARNLLKGGKGIDTFYRKSDGATLFFNKNTNEFGVLKKDGTIGTYYITSEYYWLKEIGKIKK